MIEKLTPEQKAQFPHYVDKWLKIDLATGDCDFEKAKFYAKQAYQVAGRPEPEQFYVFDSPLSAAIGVHILKNLGSNQVGDQVRDQVWDKVENQIKDQVEKQVFDQVRSQVGGQVGDQVWNQVFDQVGDQVRCQVWDQVWDKVENQIKDQVEKQVFDQVEKQVWDQVRDQVEDQIMEQVRSHVWDQVRSQVRSQVRDQVRSRVEDRFDDQAWDQVRNQVGGNHYAPWLSLYDFFLSELGLPGVEKLKPLLNLAKYTGWWAPYASVCVFQHKPDFLKFDDRNLLHSETGPAIQYRDGLSVYAWHGTRIPDEWITDKSTITPKVILRHPNIEQRRCACEILGWDKAIELMGATEIDINPNPQIGTLLSVDIPDIGKEKFIKVACGTGRTFALPVPPDVSTAQEAQNWMWQTDNYQPEIRT